MSANLPDWDLFQAAGYCNCKPYPDESCRAGWEARDFRYMAHGHYCVRSAIFRRSLLVLSARLADLSRENLT